MAKGGGKILFGLLFTVLLAGGLAGGGAWYWTEQRQESYRATALLYVAPEGSSVPIADLATLFRSDEMARAVLEKALPLYQEKSPASAPTGFEAVRDGMSVETRVALQSQSQVIHERVLRLHYTAADPELVAGVANAWATLCAEGESARATARREAQVAPLKAALESARTALEAARQKETELAATGSLEGLESAAEDSAAALLELRETARTLEATAARNEAALQALKAYAAKAPPAVALDLAVKEADGESALAGAKAESAYLLAKLPEVEAAHGAAQSALASKRRDLTVVEEEIARLTGDIQRLEETLRAAPPEGAALRVESPAVAPGRPTGPDRYMLTGAAALLGALAGLIFYFGLVALRVYARELDRG